MSGFSAPGSPDARGVLGALRSWLQSWSREILQSPEDLRGEVAGRNAIPFSSVRVLVVDDNPLNLMVISALMESKGLAPLLAADGAEAVALACKMHFDLILMDLQMPILDGLKATAAIRRFENTCSRPAVPVVAYSLESPGASVLAAHGLNGSLDKPCDDQELEDCLVRWCPTYRSAPTARGLHYDKRPWQAANQNPGSSRASLR